MSRRLLWFTQNYFPQRGGMAQSCDRIVSGLRRHGWTIDLAHFSAKWGAFQALPRRGGVDLRIPVGADVSHMLNQLWCDLPHWGGGPYAGVVIFGGSIPMIAGPVFAAWLECPLVTLIRGNDLDAAVFDPKRSLALERALRASARVAAVSGDKVEKINRLWPEVQVEWVANGINLDSWSPIPSDQQRATELRDRLLGEERSVLLGLFGHLKRKKGGEYFIEALRRSSATRSVALLIVGEVEPALQSALDSAPDLLVHHLPFADRYELMPHYLACDYVCIPSYYDGMPNVMLEAAALGVPLLASRAGGMADVLIDARHGFLFEPGQVSDCVSALRRALTASPAHRAEMAESCRALISDELTDTAELNRYHAIFESVTAHKTR